MKQWDDNDVIPGTSKRKQVVRCAAEYSRKGLGVPGVSRSDRHALQRRFD